MNNKNTGNKTIQYSKFVWLIIKLFLAISFSNAQSAEAANDSSQRTAAEGSQAFLMPRQIYVGDVAALIVPLPAVSSNIPDIIISPGQDNMPFCPNIDFHRIVLEQHVTGSRLIIEFTAFVPGTLELPVIEIGDKHFAELTVTVNSIIDEKIQPHLSEAASALAIPGTALLLYGSLAVIIFILLLTFLFLIKGRKIIKQLMEKWRLLRLFKSMRKIEKQLHEEILQGNNKRIILDRLSDEFRTFLSYITGINCRVITAADFNNIPLLLTIPDNAHNATKFPAQETPDSAKPQNSRAADSSFLSGFFRNCDTLRFSGEEISSRELLKLLDDVKQFVDLMELQQKNKQKEKQN